jgi:hypothetical protein
VETGHKDGRIVMNLYGTSEVEPSYVSFTPDEARKLGRQLLALADAVEQSDQSRH